MAYPCGCSSRFCFRHDRHWLGVNDKSFTIVLSSSIHFITKLCILHKSLEYLFSNISLLSRTTLPQDIIWDSSPNYMSYCGRHQRIQDLCAKDWIYSIFLSLVWRWFGPNLSYELVPFKFQLKLSIHSMDSCILRSSYIEGLVSLYDRFPPCKVSNYSLKLIRHIRMYRIHSVLLDLHIWVNAPLI